MARTLPISRSSSRPRAGLRAPVRSPSARRLDPVEDLGDPLLVEREHRALGQDVRHHLEPLDASVAQRDLAARRHPLGALWIDVDLRLLALGLVEGLGHEGADRVEEALLLLGRHSEEHGGPEAEQDRTAAGARAKGEGRERQGLPDLEGREPGAFELLQVEASAQKPGSRAKLGESSIDTRSPPPSSGRRRRASDRAGPAELRPPSPARPRALYNVAISTLSKFRR